MPLELTAIDPHAPDRHESVAAIPLQAHEYIMMRAQSNGLTLLCRMKEYWGDTLYESHELDGLRGELAQVRELLNPHDQESELMSDLLVRMDFVITKAQQIGGHVEAIAD